jgi:hypothetical protein
VSGLIRWRACPALLLVAAGIAATPAAASGPPPREAGCAMFPANYPLNEEIANAPVSPDSAQYIAAIGASAHLHPDFGRPPSYGIPYTIVAAKQPNVSIDFTEFPEESDPGPYPIPPNAPVEGAGARSRPTRPSRARALDPAQRARRGRGR